MALDVDTRHPLRRPGELAQLVRAVLEADPNDETSWLEWKSALDLMTAAGRFQIAKGILGMANRMPAQAQSNCGGVGYILVGVEPGNLRGIEGVDPAQLDDGLSPYVGGARGPSWGATYVEVEGSSVLVVTVEAPEAGDPIHLLRKAYDNFHAGTVFARKNGKTAPADADDLDALQARLRDATSSSLELEVSAVGDVPLSWVDSGEVEPAIREWAEGRRADLIAEGQQTARLKERQDSAPIEFSTASRALNLEQLSRAINPFAKQEERTLQDFSSEVEAWAEQLVGAAVDTWPARYAKQGHGVIRLHVKNPTDRNLHDVEIKATFPGDDVVGFDELPYIDRLPSPPRKYGEPVNLGMSLSHSPIAFRHLPLSAEVPEIRSTWVEEGSVRIVWAVGDLRPKESDESDDVYVFLRARPSDGYLRGTWEGRSKSADGVLEGELQVPLAEQPVDVVSVLKKPSREDG